MRGVFLKRVNHLVPLFFIGRRKSWHRHVSLMDDFLLQPKAEAFKRGKHNIQKKNPDFALNLLLLVLGTSSSGKQQFGRSASSCTCRSILVC